MNSRSAGCAALALLMLSLSLSLSGCDWLQRRGASNSMVTAPKGPEAAPPQRRPEEAPTPAAAPQPKVQAAPIAPPPRR